MGSTCASYWGLRSPPWRSRDAKRSTPPFFCSPNIVKCCHANSGSRDYRSISAQMAAWSDAASTAFFISS